MEVFEWLPPPPSRLTRPPPPYRRLVTWPKQMKRPARGMAGHKRIQECAKALFIARIANKSKIAARRPPTSPTSEAFLTIVSEQAARALEGIEEPGYLQMFRLHPADERLVLSRYQIGDVERMVQDAIADSNNGHNVYIEGRTVRRGLGAKERGKIEDTVRCFALVIDADADTSKTWTPPQGVLPSLEIKSSAGTGNRQYWFFLEQAVSPDDAKKLGARMRASSGGDSKSGDPVQPWRVAGTINYPSAAKQRRGRVVTPTRLVNHSGKRWTVAELEAAFPAPQKRPASEAVGNADDESAVDPELMKLIEEGVPEGHRSEVFYRVVATLKQRHGFSVDGIVTLLEKYPNGIAAKYAGRVVEEVRRVYEKIKDDNADKLGKMNKEYCVVQDGGKVRVLMFEKHTQKIGRYEHVRQVPTFLSFPDFRNFHLNQTIKQHNKIDSVGNWWLRHHGRRQYAGITFQPNGGAVINDRLNLWRGWGISPEKGDWSLMRDHILEVLASGDEAFCAYVINWLAWAVQHPDEQAEVALVFRGKRGTGKGTLGNAMCRIFGQHAVHISNVKYLSGFNAHLRDACFLFADEALWPGDRKIEGDFKRLITEPTLLIEGKGRDAITTRNMLHVLMASNEDWIVPAGERERRFAMCDVSECHIQDEEYFRRLHTHLQGGGYGAMLHDLLHQDLGDWHPRRFPQTGALLEQQRRSLPPLDAWIVELFESGTLMGADPTAPNRAVSNAYDREWTVQTENGEQVRIVKQQGLYDQARTIEPRLRYHCNDHHLGAHLRKLGCDNTKRVLRRRGWTFPPLRECRKAWEARYPGWTWRDPSIEEWRHEEDGGEEHGDETSGKEHRKGSRDDFPF